MKHCSKCKKDVDSDSKFCNKCGTELKLIDKQKDYCCSCGCPVYDVSEFCVNCGKRLFILHKLDKVKTLGVLYSCLSTERVDLISLNTADGVLLHSCLTTGRLLFCKDNGLLSSLKARLEDTYAKDRDKLRQSYNLALRDLEGLYDEFGIN